MKKRKTEITEFKFDWKNEHLAEDAGPFFLTAYRRIQESHKALHDAAMAKATNATDEDSESSVEQISIGPENVPEEHLDIPLYRRLMRFRAQIIERLSTLLPETDDAKLAAIIVTGDLIARHTLRFINGIVYFLMLDNRLHPERRLKINALGVLGLDMSEAEMREELETLLVCTTYCNLKIPLEFMNSVFTQELGQLQTAGDCFYLVLQSVFPINAVNKCHQAFSLLMGKIGRPDYVQELTNYIRRTKTLYRALVDYQQHGGQVANPFSDSATMAKITEAVGNLTMEQQKCATAVANMDRRLRTFLSWLKGIFTGLSKLIHKSQGVIKRDAVIKTVTANQNLHEALKNINEPRRSQLIAIIKYTHRVHPISFKDKGKDAFTLSHAAQAVWDENEVSWSVIPGTYASFGSFKAACYDLQKSDHDPFKYAK